MLLNLHKIFCRLLYLPGVILAGNLGFMADMLVIPVVALCGRPCHAGQGGGTVYFMTVLVNKALFGDLLHNNCWPGHSGLALGCCWGCIRWDCIRLHGIGYLLRCLCSSGGISG